MTSYNNEEKVLKVLEREGSPLNTSDLAYKCGIDVKNIGRYVNALYDEGKVDVKTLQIGQKRFKRVSLRVVERPVERAVEKEIRPVIEEKKDLKVVQVQEEKKKMNHLITNFDEIRNSTIDATPAKFSDNFVVAWDVLKISVDSMFKSSKWRSMAALWKIVKTEIEAKR